MSRPDRRPPPLWFAVALAALWALVCHALDLHALETSPVTLAFFGWLVVVGELIWTALQAVGQATLVALNWTVHALWLIAKELRNGLASFGSDLLKGFKASWDFIRKLYDNVLKPAWVKFWHLVDRLHDTLERIFRPVFKFLYQLRAELLKFYTKWVRPVLDTIGVAREILRVLSALHVSFARTLDAKLGELQDAIDRPFRFLLQKLNETINLVNRVVTLNGLIQRLALVRSIERDIRYVSRAFVNWRSAPLTEQDYERARNDEHRRTIGMMERDTAAALEGRESYYTPIVNEMAVQWEIYLRNSARGIS